MDQPLATHLERAVDALAGILASVGDARALRGVPDTPLLELVERIEAIGRSADALRVLIAGEVADRSRPMLGMEGLAYRRGAANASELLQRTARVGAQTARARLRLGERVLPAVSIHGEVCPAQFPEVRDGLVSGRLGLDTAELVTRELARVSVGVPMDLLTGVHTAERALVCAALGEPAAPGDASLPPVAPWETEVQVAAWRETLAPDGAEPSFREFESRSFRLGRERGGLIPVTGLLLPEVAGRVQRVFDALTNPRQSLTFLTDDERAELEATGARDTRSRPQRQHDVLATVFDVAGRSGELPTLGGASATMLVTISAADHASGRGVGHVDGLGTPISMAAVRQLSCANGIQPIEFGANGRIHRIGTTERTFNRAQRRALAARDGGCLIPGCPIPAWACEAHHVIEWRRDEKTHVDNGVLLCWFHHRTIDSSGWRIRMVDGAPEVMPPPGVGDQAWRPSTKSPVRIAEGIRRGFG